MPDCSVRGGIGAMVAARTAQQAVVAEKPIIAGLRNGRARARFGYALTIGGLAASLFAGIEHALDLAEIETGQFDVELAIEQSLQLRGQRIATPSGQFGETIVGDQIGALFARR